MQPIGEVICVRESQPIVELLDVRKAFGGVPVLSGVSFSISKGSVHGLIGGNGAGKSTLMKIMSGVYQPDGGIIRVEGREVTLRSPLAAHQRGIYLVPQDPTLFPDMTIEENVLLGLREANRRELRQKFLELIKALRCEFEPHELAGEVSLAKQQQIELIRGLIREPKVIILDEPTSALTAKEAQALFANIRKLKAEKNISFVYITHRLGELFEIVDELTVLKDAKVVANGPISDFTLQRVLELMVPDVKLTSQNGVQQQQRSGQLKPIFEVRDLSGHGFSDVNFTVSAGEVLTITGVVGAGRTELAETIFGVRKPSKGQLILDGREIQIKNPRAAINYGLAYVPENRHLHGGFLDSNLVANVCSSVMERLSAFLNASRKQKDLCRKTMSDLQIKAKSEDQLLRQLSGGNQQKVVLGKWLATEPKVIFLDEPTRGIDANTREEIYLNIRRLSNAGIGVVVISSDFEEVSILSDRVLVMHKGRVVSELTPPNINPKALTYAAFGYAEGEAIA